MRLAIVSTHPIQYYAPAFKLLHQHNGISIKVFYTDGESPMNRYDRGFNRNINWDIPLLDGYPYEFIKNTFNYPGTRNFKHLVNLGLIGKIKEYGADAVLVYGWAYQSHLAVLLYFKNKIPVYFRGDSTLLDRNAGLKNVLKHIFLKWVYAHVDFALYAGINNKAYFKKNGLKENQLIFVPHAIDNQRFATVRHEEVKHLKQRLKINNNDVVILFAGKFEDKKDPLLLLKAFIKLHKPHVKLVFVGNGDLEQQLKKEANDITNIHFINFQNQSYMPVIYQACDVFCLPSKGPGETWGLAVNEAMACSKAVLLSDKVGCAIDLIKPGVNGRIFKAGDLNDLIDNLDLLLGRTKNELAKMGKHSAEMIAHWSFIKLVEFVEANTLKA